MVNITLSKKQHQTYQYLTDNTHTEIFYGGAAAGGKSFLACFWLITNAVKYPGSRGLMGRARLTALKQSTLLTFFDVCKILGFKPERDYHYNAMSNVIKFWNGTEIYLKDLFQYPADPEFDSLGSTEFTYAVIDEASQITDKAKQIVTSRLRYKLEEFNLIPKLFISSNPSKNFLYTEFYKPWKKNELEPHRIFIQAFVQDNKHVSKEYVETLKRLDKKSKERLLYGNWEYDDDPSLLMDFDKITDLFTNNYVEKQQDDYYLTVDVARFGRDRAVILVWKGLYVKKIISYKKSDTVMLKNKILSLSDEYKIPRSRIVIDQDGVGGGLVDELSGCKGFINGASPFYEGQITNFQNLKTQCYFKLADKVNNGEIGINCEDPEIKQLIIEDLEQIKRKNMDKDGKLQIISKEEIKENIGRSTDFSDALMMRMYFELKGGNFKVFFDDTGKVF